MIAITGDIHGEVDDLLWNLDKKFFDEPVEEQTIILLGDVGLNYYGNSVDVKKKEKLQNSGRTYFCIHGNHEERPQNIGTYVPTVWNGGIVYIEEKYPNIIFAKDGEVYDLFGIKTLVLGGAYSVDKWYRIKSGYNWFPNEQISAEERNRIYEKVKQLGSIDMVLSHTCPYQWRPTDLFLDFIDQNSVDNTMEYWLTEIEKILDYKLWFFGHYHDDRRINEKAMMLYKMILSLKIEDLVNGR